MASIEEIQKRALKRARRNALNAVKVSGVSALIQLVAEFATTVGATGMLGLAVHLPYGVLRTAAAGFAGLASVRWFLIPPRPKTTAAPVSAPEHHNELGQLHALLEQLGHQAQHQDAKAPANASGPYL